VTISHVCSYFDSGRWNDSNCDMVHGSDGASFNPYIQQVFILFFSSLTVLLFIKGPTIADPLIEGTL
jgi:hypothetical protein